VEELSSHTLPNPGAGGDRTIRSLRFPEEMVRFFVPVDGAPERVLRAEMTLPDVHRTVHEVDMGLPVLLGCSCQWSGSGTLDVGAGAAGAAEVAEKLNDPLPADLVQCRRRLVGEDDLGIRHQRPGDGDPLLLPAGQLRRQIVHAAFQAHQTENVLGGQALSFGVATAVHLLRHQYVLSGSETVDQCRLWA